MRVIIVSAEFPPMRSSGSVQMRDLLREFVSQGHDVVGLMPTHLPNAAEADAKFPCRIHRPNVPNQKTENRLRRALAEAVMPLLTLRYVLRRRREFLGADLVVWYSPSIFHGPVIALLRWMNRCPGYLIVRDIFPEWALDMGLMRKGLAYRIFRWVADLQYRVADTIAVQTPGNRVYFESWARRGHRIEVLHNWLGPAPAGYCSIDLSKSSLAGRKVFVYAGNMGIAQDMPILLELAQRLRSQPDVGFLFVGRGSVADSLRRQAAEHHLDNVLFFDEIAPEEIAGLYTQCAAGLVALDPRHRTHNIPGKFLPYMAAGLPVLARVNPGNDLVDLIRKADVGETCTDTGLDALHEATMALLSRLETDPGFTLRCQALSASMFSASAAVRQITEAAR